MKFRFFSWFVYFLTFPSFVFASVFNSNRLPGVESPNKTSIETLFGNPVFLSPQLSPQGDKIAYLAPIDGKMNLWVRSIDSKNTNAVALTDDRKVGINFYQWAPDGKHIFLVRDTAGDENWHLYLLNIHSKDVTELTPFPGVQAGLIAADKRFPNEVLVSMNKDNREFHDVYRLFLNEKKFEKVAKNTGEINSWIPDADLKVRGAIKAKKDGGFDLIVRDTEQDPWRTLVEWKIEDGLNSAPVGFSRDGKFLIVKDSSDTDTARLVKIDIQTGQKTVLVEDSEYDVEDALLDPDTREVFWVTVYRDRPETVFIGEEFREDLDAVQKIQAGDFYLQSMDAFNKKWLIAFVSDIGPLSFYVYDRKTKTSKFLFDDRPELRNEKLMSMKPVSFQSRDGLTIHGYLTLPEEKKTQAPLILNVHGGPWNRNKWGFDPTAQWIARLGFACLQVNFRGSSGYGKKFLNGGDKEWGGKMNEDLEDAVQWAIQQGIAKKDSIVIMGRSYGGYAALAGAAFSPEVYRAAIAQVAPTNLITFIQTIPPYWETEKATFLKRVGDPETEADFLKSRSPYFHAEQIKIPLFINHGANDQRVKKEESEEFVKRLDQLGVDYEYILFPDEGHVINKPENRYRYFQAVENFLRKHLPECFEKNI